MYRRLSRRVVVEGHAVPACTRRGTGGGDLYGVVVEVGGEDPDRQRAPRGDELRSGHVELRRGVCHRQLHRFATGEDDRVGATFRRRCGQLEPSGGHETHLGRFAAEAHRGRRIETVSMDRDRRGLSSGDRRWLEVAGRRRLHAAADDESCEPPSTHSAEATLRAATPQTGDGSQGPRRAVRDDHARRLRREARLISHRRGTGLIAARCHRPAERAGDCRSSRGAEVGAKARVPLPL